MRDSFVVKQDQYEGPLETIINLLRKRKLHVSDVNLAQITDDFAAYINKEQTDSIAELSDFVRVMSVLLLIKTKALLPKEVLGVDDEETIAQFAADLKRIEVLQEAVDEILVYNSFFVAASEKPKSVPAGFIPDESITIEQLFKSVDSISEEISREETFAKVAVKKLANLKTTIDSIERRLVSLGETELHNIIPDSMPTEDKVVHFIALLELLKQNTLTLKDANGEKVIQYGHITVPAYGITKD